MTETLEQQVDKSINEMLDCFGGADGGVSFVRLKSFTAGLVKKMEDPTLPDHEASRQLLKIVIQMGSLINTIKK